MAQHDAAINARKGSHITTSCVHAQHLLHGQRTWCAHIADRSGEDPKRVTHITAFLLQALCPHREVYDLCQNALPLLRPATWQSRSLVSDKGLTVPQHSRPGVKLLAGVAGVEVQA
jgi:hypothetical protein